jgi:uncharacterized protein
MAHRKNRHAAELSRLGSQKGGRARARALTSPERSRIARRAAAARWGKPRYDERQLRALCERHGLTTLYLFGSILRDDFGADSDVDVMVEFAEAPSFEEYLNIQEELEAIFGRKVDLVTKQAVETNPSATRRESILRTARLIHG